MSPFDSLTARGLIAQLLVASLLVELALFALAGGGIVTLDERVSGLLLQGVMALVVFSRLPGAGLTLRSLFGERMTRSAVPLLVVVVPLFLISFGAFYLVFVPLSYDAPQWVARHIVEPTFYDARTPLQLVALLLVAVVGAPLAEEIFFRGVLLQRWSRRWGTRTGVIASSALFAVMHGEWIGHFVVGVALCALFLRTRSLWVPIAAHALNNLLAVLPTVWSAIRHEPPEPPTTLAELRGGMGLAQLALLGGLVLLWLYLDIYWPDHGFRAALDGPTPYDAMQERRPKDAPRAE